MSLIFSFTREQVKKYAVHAAFLGLVAAVSLQGRAMAGVSHNSLLYTLVSGEEVIEGPLDPSAYAQTDAPGVGGARLAAVNAGAGIDIITFDNPEVQFSATLGGNVVMAPLSPVLPDSDQGLSAPSLQKARVYTVRESDTIAGIAEQFGVSTNTILAANGLTERDIIKVGDHLTILPTSGALHTVSSGDTLLAVANRYDVAVSEIVEFNNLTDAHKLSIGQKLIIPGATVSPANVPRIVPGGTRIASRNPDGPTPQPASVSGAGMLWPTTTRHISQYFRWGHTGIDIDSRSRPAIYAAEAGTVEFAGWLGAYGNLIIINHGNGLQTYYAHNQAHYVTKGTKVAKGDAIAKMGSTGRSTGPHVHFEVRRNGRPINPLGMF